MKIIKNLMRSLIYCIRIELEPKSYEIEKPSVLINGENTLNLFN